jgi:hypothetical protein
MWKILTVRSKKYTLELLMFSKSFLSCVLMAALVLPAGAQDNTGVGIWSIGNVFMDAGLTPLMGAANPGEGATSFRSVTSMESPVQPPQPRLGHQSGTPLPQSAGWVPQMLTSSPR